MFAIMLGFLGLFSGFAFEGPDAMRYEEAHQTKNYPFARLIKNRGYYRLRGITKVSVPLKGALPVIGDVAEYPNWAWKRINTRRKGATGRYLVNLHPLIVEPQKNIIQVRYHLNRFFKGKRRFRMRYITALTGEEAVPTFAMTIKTTTRLVKELSGEVRFYPVEGEEAFYIHFTGRIKVHWAIYYLIPLRFIRVDAEERVLTVLENAALRVAGG